MSGHCAYGLDANLDANLDAALTRADVGVSARPCPDGVGAPAGGRWSVDPDLIRSAPVLSLAGSPTRPRPPSWSRFQWRFASRPWAHAEVVPSRDDPPDAAPVAGARVQPGRTRAGPGSEVPHLLDLRAVATRLSLSERHVRRLVEERRIPYLKVGRLLRFDPGEIAEWLDATRVPVHQPRWRPQVLQASGGSRAAAT